MHYVYLLQLSNGSLYTGRSDNLKRRIDEHQSGKVASTTNKRPFQLIYYEGYLSKQDAIDRELYLKTGDGRRAVRRQLKNSLNVPADGGEVG